LQSDLFETCEKGARDEAPMTRADTDRARAAVEKATTDRPRPSRGRT